MRFNTLYDFEIERRIAGGPKLEEVVEMLELVPNENGKKKREEQQEIKKAIEKEALKEHEWRELEEKREKIKEGNFNVKIPANVYYSYILPSKKKQLAAYYTFVPSNVQIFRVPATVLGYNVLGCAFLGANVVYIRDNLHGDEFEEVKRHELNHITHPYMTENQIREKTKAELPFEARFH